MAGGAGNAGQELQGRDGKDQDRQTGTVRGGGQAEGGGSGTTGRRRGREPHGHPTHPSVCQIASGSKICKLLQAGKETNHCLVVVATPHLGGAKQVVGVLAVGYTRVATHGKKPVNRELQAAFLCM